MAKKKRKVTKVDLSEIDEHIRIAREVVARGWAELEAKYAAEGRPMPGRPPAC